MLLTLRSISKKFNNQQVLKNIDFTVDSKQFISIIGKSGVGKTTLLSILAGLVQPDEGEVIFEGQQITHFSEEELARYRLINIGIVFQDFKIIPSLSVYDNVFLALHPRQDITKKEKQDRVNKIVSQVELEHKLSETVDNLSGGEKQRVAIARSLVGRPKLVLADEPTGNLDEVTSENIIELFQKLHDELATTFIIITHDNDIAKKTKINYRLTKQNLEIL